VSRSTNRPSRLVAARRPLAGLIILTVLALGLLLPLPAAAKYNIIQLDDNYPTYGDDALPTMNNKGEIIYHHFGWDVFDYSVDPPKYLYSELDKYQLYQGGSVTTLPIVSNSGSSYGHPWPILLNDRGQMGYGVDNYNTGKYELYFHDGFGAPPHLLASRTGGAFPCQQLNQKGQMVWMDLVGNGDLQIYLFDPPHVSQITNYAGISETLWLNDAGQVVWVDRTYDASAQDYYFNPKLSDSNETIK
jgi:hypothetical protein